MTQDKGYLIDCFDNAVVAVIAGIDNDIAHGEDILMLGLGVVMMSSFFAPIAPPAIILPLVAITFALSAGFARKNYRKMERKLSASLQHLEGHEKALLRPIADVFAEYPLLPLTESFNPLKNLTRTWKSALGGLLINPLWMPIFYVMGMQISEEKTLIILNKAIAGIKQNILPPSSFC